MSDQAKAPEISEDMAAAIEYRKRKEAISLIVNMDGAFLAGIQHERDALERYRDKLHEQINLLESQLESTKDGYDSVTRDWNRERDNANAARAENSRLRHINKKFKVFGTDGCKSCETGRITLFFANDECISCNPESYELVTPAEGKNL